MIDNGCLVRRAGRVLQDWTERLLEVPPPRPNGAILLSTAVQSGPDVVDAPNGTRAVPLPSHPKVVASGVDPAAKSDAANVLVLNPDTRGECINKIGFLTTCLACILEWQAHWPLPDSTTRFTWPIV